MNTEKGKERRCYPRYKNPDAEVSYKLLDPRRWSNYQGLAKRALKDLSLGGVSFSLDEKVMETKLPIAMDILLGKKGLGPIKTFGRVAWAKDNSAQGQEVGIAFNWWAKEEDKKALVEFIEQSA